MTPNIKLIRLKDVIDSTGLARSTIYKYIDKGIFPKAVTLGGRAVAWVESEVQEWILERIELRDNAKI
ncbi:Predicted transcriptional regulator [Shewanella baltica]|uniref:helix-turn-helix transcriptional regulator n=1 Tax=Shewanella baltica TaxID=62322 RepID=UPI000F6BE110|nr:AlpA family transcriptional regulator [Shewanella baltica]VEF26302.1 Predicted transcriptional regulator [Shewanella baltica]